MIADPRRTLYRALHTHRPSPLWVVRPRVIAAGIRALLRRERYGWSRGDDTLQQGADVVVDGDGEIALLHLARHPADRVDVATLIARASALTSGRARTS